MLVELQVLPLQVHLLLLELLQPEVVEGVVVLVMYQQQVGMVVQEL
jgi:hypothetical protein